MPGTSLGLPALPAGGVRSAARSEPAATQGILLPPVAADARRPLHDRLGPYAARIDQILDRFDPAELAAAATNVTDSDDEIPLRPEERTA